MSVEHVRRAEASLSAAQDIVERSGCIIVAATRPEFLHLLALANTQALVALADALTTRRTTDDVDPRAYH